VKCKNIRIVIILMLNGSIAIRPPKFQFVKVSTSVGIVMKPQNSSW
jgi:hypothetical protein